MLAARSFDYCRGPMKSPTLKIVARTQGNTSALKNGEIELPGFLFDFIEIPALPKAFRRMVRTLEFDVCEMALTTYLCAREHGVKFTAIPIFLKRAFHHGAILHDSKGPIKKPKQLEGTYVGVNRGYTVTAGVWARGILAEEYNVDLEKITWVLSGDEHVAEYKGPSNVITGCSNQTLEDALLCGDLSAAINVQTNDPSIKPLIPDPQNRGLSAFDDRGHYPINHLLVIRDEVLEKNPGIAIKIFNVFAEAKSLYLDQLKNKEAQNLTSTDELDLQILKRKKDPLPYGIKPNRDVLENLMAHAQSQKILKQNVEVDELFAQETIDLNA